MANINGEMSDEWFVEVFIEGRCISKERKNGKWFLYELLF